MDISRPYSAVVPTLDGPVLAALAGTSRPLTGREIARLVSEGSQKGVLLVLNRLVEHGLVERQEAGNALLHTLNRDHLATPAVEVLARMRTELLRRLRQAIEGWKPACVHASVFGSAARGDGNTSSDIDLFVVRPLGVGEDDPDWRSQLDALAVDVRLWTGNHAAIAEVSEGELERLRDQSTPIVDELRSEAIGLIGDEPATLLDRGS